MKAFRANYIDFLPFYENRSATSEKLSQRNIPNRRNGYYHMSMTCVRKMLYIFGGIDRTRVPKEGFIKFDPKTSKSTQILTRKGRKEYYNVRSASCSKMGDCTFFFGGLSSNESKLNRKRIFQVVKFDFKKSIYESQLLRKFDLRYGHTTVIYEGKAYLYGGDFDVEDNDVYVLNCHKMKSFRKVKTDKSRFKPLPAFGHGSVVIGHHMYVFFGAVDNFGNSSNQVARLDLNRMVWEEVYVCRKPHPRFGVGCVKSSRTQMVYIFGGSEGSSKLTNELLEFDPRLRMFRSIEITNQVPQPRFGHSIALSEDDKKLWIFGGVTGRLRCDYDTSLCRITNFSTTDCQEPLEGMRYKHQYLDCVVLTQH